MFHAKEMDGFLGFSKLSSEHSNDGSRWCLNRPVFGLEQSINEQMGFKFKIFIAKVKHHSVLSL